MINNALATNPSSFLLELCNIVLNGQMDSNLRQIIIVAITKMIGP